MLKFMRVLLALALCPTLGAMLGRYYASRLLPNPGAELWGWGAGAVGGLLYAIALSVLSTSPRGTAAKATGDLVLVGLCLLAIVDLASQLLRADMPVLVHVTGATYLMSLLIVLCTRRDGGYA